MAQPDAFFLNISTSDKLVFLIKFERLDEVCTNVSCVTVPDVRRLDAGFPLQSIGFNPR
jgi:hypothetical protein